MLEIQNQALSFTFPDIHPQARLNVSFQRTLRIPDDGKTYPLPPGLGNFPLKHLDDYKDRVPEKWLKRGGVMLPMYQSEALWISFSSTHLPEHGTSYPFAVKIGAGKRSAVTGKVWSKSMREDDYCVIPGQRWIDGFVVDEGLIKQFVAVPLGMGLTAEAQLSGKEEFGGIQIEVLPMLKEKFLKRFPVRPVQRDTRILRRGFTLCSDSYSDDGLIGSTYFAAAAAAAPAADMGLGAGGKMKQEIFKDPYGLTEWDADTSNRCFVHLANSLAWRVITKEAPPTVPYTAADYTRHGLPWFDHYDDGAKALGATEKMKGLKSILELGYQKGIQGILPENESVDIPSTKIVQTGDKRPGTVRDGIWK